MDKEYTRAEESTDNRLLKLEAKYIGDVRIYPAEPWEIVIAAYGSTKKLRLKKLIDGKEYMLSDEEIEHYVDLAITELHYEQDQKLVWESFCKKWGLNA